MIYAGRIGSVLGMMRKQSGVIIRSEQFTFLVQPDQNLF